MSSAIVDIFDNPTLKSLRLSLQTAGARHQAIASNIANVNTPGYQRVDLSENFKTALKQAYASIEARETFPNMPKVKIEEAVNQGPARRDGNTVQLEKELIELSKNSAQFELASQLLSRHYQGIKTAIKGRSTP